MQVYTMPYHEPLGIFLTNVTYHAHSNTAHFMDYPPVRKNAMCERTLYMHPPSYDGCPPKEFSTFFAFFASEYCFFQKTMYNGCQRVG